MIGQTLGKYKIEQRLGEGGMGLVYLARDPLLDRPVAIKMLHLHLANQAEFQQRFQHEARATAMLDHPGIVKIYELGRTSDFLYIVMEFVPGENLHRLLSLLRQRRQWLLLSEAVLLIQQLAPALDHAHRLGVFHRDVKPANIMFKPAGDQPLGYRPLLTDMGLAKLSAGAGVTQTGMTMGTPAYMAPEQALGQEVSAASDIYALGVVLYELAVGRLPFPLTTLSEAFHLHRKATVPPPPSTVRPDLPAALEQVILKALSHKPQARFASATALAAALAALPLSTLPITPPTLEMTTAVSLLTVYTPTIAPQAAAVPPPAPMPPAEAVYNQLRIVDQKQRRERTVAVNTTVLTIGRIEDNQIQLDDPRVSRRHARIAVHDQQYTVTDLESVNGTYLGSKRLASGATEPWPPNEPLRIGDHLLYLVAGPAPVASPPPLPPIKKPVSRNLRQKIGGLLLGIGAVGLLLWSQLSEWSTQRALYATATAQQLALVLTKTADSASATAAAAALATQSAAATKTAQAKPTATKTPTPRPRVTRTPTRRPTATRAFTPTPLPATIQDQFDGNHYAWDVGAVQGDLVNGRQEMVNSKYQWTLSSAEGALLYSLPTMRPIDDFMVSVDLQLARDVEFKAAGLLVRYANNEYYVFEISNRGAYKFSLRTAGQWETLLPWTTNSAIQVDQTNRATVIAKGSRFLLFANGRFLTEIVHSQLARGHVGLVAELSKGTNAVYRFDNFAVRATTTVDDFSSARTGLGCLTGDVTHNDNTLTRQIVAGKYQWKVSPKEGLVWSTYCASAAVVDNFYFEIDAQRTDGLLTNAYGVTFRHRDEDNYYLFEIREDQTFRFLLLAQNKWHTLQGWTTHSGIHSDRANRIGIYAEGSRFAFFINDQHVLDSEDDTIERGEVLPVIDVDADKQASFTFDNYTLIAE